VVLSGNTLYGTANFGGSWGYGTVFAVNADGTGFTNVHNFNFYDVNDAADPYGGLIASGNTLYGTTLSGGAFGNGTVFSLNTDGTGFTNVYSFTAYSGSASTNGDGLSPCGGLILSGDTLYGTTGGGGSSGKGTVFKVNTNGTGFMTLHSFTALSNGTNCDGGHPEDGLILSGNTLYGTASEGGASGGGTVFAVNTDGAGFTNLHSFGTGSFPNATAGLFLSGNMLYGTTVYGGSSGQGTVFSLSLGAPQLTITESGTNIILTWPANATGFTLQSVTNLISPVVWGAVSPAPTVVNGQFAVTNPVCGTQMFYRLSQ
jgi:uncharacterized repeat protein (TIGR03803 family)